MRLDYIFVILCIKMLSQIMTYYFYSLNDPESNEVRYIGVTTYSLARRFAQHKSAANLNKDQTHKTKWFRSIMKKGLLPTINLIKSYVCDDNSWELIEQNLIKLYPNLTNHHSGGAGVILGERKRTSEINSKPVVKIHPWKNVILETYRSATIAEKQILGNHTGVIGQTANGKHKHTAGYRWSFLDPLIFSPPLPYIFVYSNGQLIKDYPSQNAFRADLSNLLKSYETFTVTNITPTFSN